MKYIGTFYAFYRVNCFDGSNSKVKRFRWIIGGRGVINLFSVSTTEKGTKTE